MVPLTRGEVAVAVSGLDGSKCMGQERRFGSMRVRRSKAWNGLGQGRQERDVQAVKTAGRMAQQMVWQSHIWQG